MSGNYSLPKKEHLCGEIRINKLFAEGKAFIVYPLRVVYAVRAVDDVPVKVLFSVPKKRFKRAVKRNRLKRLMRESYRLNKNTLVHVVNEKQVSVEMAFAYLSDEVMEFNIIQEKMQLILNKIATRISDNYPSTNQ